MKMTCPFCQSEVEAVETVRKLEKKIQEIRLEVRNRQREEVYRDCAISVIAQIATAGAMLKEPKTTVMYLEKALAVIEGHARLEGIELRVR